MDIILILAYILSAWLIFYSIFVNIIYLGALFYPRLKYKPLTRYYKVAVLIPTYNDDCTEGVMSVLNSNYPNEYINIYILSDCDNPELIKKLKSLADKYKNVYFVDREPKRKGFKAGNLNYGIKYALQDEEVVVCLDADSKVPKDYFEKILSVLEQGYDICSVMYKTETRNKSLLSYFASIYAELHVLFAPVLNIFGSATTPGTGFAVKRKVFKDVLFDENCLGEDIKFSQDAYEKGYRVYFDPNNFVYVVQPTSISQVNKQLTRWIYGGMQILFERIRFTPYYFFLLLYAFHSIVVIPMLWLVTMYLIIFKILLINSLLVIFSLYIAGLLSMFGACYIYFKYYDFAKHNMLERIFVLISFMPLFEYYMLKCFLLYWKDKILNSAQSWIVVKKDKISYH